jgi:hypothetical protein
MEVKVPVADWEVVKLAVATTGMSGTELLAPPKPVKIHELARQ